METFDKLKTAFFISTLILSFVAYPYFEIRKTNSELRDENKSLIMENGQLESYVKTSKSTLEDLRSDIRNRNNELAILEENVYKKKFVLDFETEFSKLKSEYDKKNEELKLATESVNVLKNDAVSYADYVNNKDEFKRLKDESSKKYVLTLRLSQSHFTLNVGTHIKDSMNATTFEISVGKEYYDAVTVGQNIVDDFRVGSLIMDGSFGDFEVEVTKKEIR